MSNTENQPPPVKIRLHCLKPTGDPSILPNIGQDEEGYFISAPPERVAELAEVGRIASESGRRFLEVFAEGAD